MTIQKYTVFAITLFTWMMFATEVQGQLTVPDNSEDGLRGAPHVYKYDARTTAMGDATVGDPGVLSTININPAALSFVRDLNAVQMTMRQNWENNFQLVNLSFPMAASRSHRMAGQVAYHHPGFRSANFLDEPPFVEPEMHMYQFDFNYAFSYDNVLSLGVLNSTTYAQAENAQYWTNFTTLGVLYAPSRAISYGAAFRGLGRSVIYDITDDGRTTLGSQALREVLELGATIYVPVDTDRHYMSFSLANEKRFGENGIWYKAGLEVLPISSLSLRSGILFHSRTHSVIPRYGLGINTEVLSLDYSIAPHPVFERFHQLAITIKF